MVRIKKDTSEESAEEKPKRGFSIKRVEKSDHVASNRAKNHGETTGATDPDDMAKKRGFSRSANSRDDQPEHDDCDDAEHDDGDQRLNAVERACCSLKRWSLNCTCHRKIPSLILCLHSGLLSLCSLTSFRYVQRSCNHADSQAESQNPF